MFGLVALAELPDKTMIATLVMGSRNRPVLVWLGASAAFVLHVALAVGAGRLVLLLPRRAIEIATTALFFAGAVFLLAVPERHEEEAGEAEVARIVPAAAWRVVGTAFGVIALGELGDLTQVLTLNLAARYRDPLSVFVGAAAGLLAVGAVGAWGGRGLLRWLPLAAIRRAGGVVLLGFTAYGVYSLVR